MKIRKFLNRMWHKSEPPIQDDETYQVIRDNGIWFIDIPRTGSTSIKFTLEKHFGTLYGKSYYRATNEVKKTAFHDHTPAADVLSKIGSEHWEKMYTFSFVRNPWERFHSMYKYRSLQGEFKIIKDFKEYVSWLQKPNKKNRESPHAYPFYRMSMCDYLTDSDGRILVDDVFKFEERDQALAKLQTRVGIDFSLEWRESSDKIGTYRDFYDEESASIVAHHFQDDIKRFGYEF